MDTRPITAQRLAASVIAVPPLARHADGTLNRIENARLIRHIEAGGVSTLLYGGNANLYHSRPSEYGKLLALLVEEAAAETLVVPAVGPAYGVMMDQAQVLSESAFPTAMVLPQVEVTTFAGIATGIRRFVEAAGRPVVLYLKDEGYLDPEHARKLCDDGLVSWVKYAIVRADAREDAFLRSLVDLVEPRLIVSGMGEQPAMVHLRSFGLGAFTSGCVCVNPSLSRCMLEALKEGDDATAESIRERFEPLENLRNEINPIRVLHEAVALSGIVDTGPLLPFLSAIDPGERDRVRAAACALRAQSLAGAG